MTAAWLSGVAAGITLTLLAQQLRNAYRNLPRPTYGANTGETP